MGIGISGIMWLLLGVIAASVLGQTVIFISSRNNKVSLLMILLGILSFGYLFSSMMLHVYTYEVDYEWVFKWQINLYFLQAICMLFVFYQYGNGVNRLLFSLNVFWLTFMLLTNMVLPTGLIYQSFYEPELFFEFFGESYYLTLGELQPMYGIYAVITYILQYTFVGAMIWSFYRSKNDYKVFLFSLFFLIFLVANVLDVLVDVGQIKFIYSSEYVGILVLFLLTVDLLVYTINNQRFEREVGLLRSNIQSIIENSGVYFIGLDVHGRIGYVNEHLSKKSGLHESAFLGKSIKEIVGEDQNVNELNTWLNNNASAETCDFSINTNSLRPLYMSWTKVNLQNIERSVVDVFLIGIDVTENRLVQDELQKVNSEIERMRQDLINENTYLKEVVVDTQNATYDYFESWLVPDPLKPEIDKAASSDLNVLLIGETGVGKELIAEGIAKSESRKDTPFLKVKCGAFSKFQLESELFGYVKGAFPEAVKDAPGKLGLVNGGTLFLDRVHELPIELQKKLMYVLESGEYKPMGSQNSFKTKFKLVASSNFNLKTLRTEDYLMDDFYYQITTLPIVVTPLRDRMTEFKSILNGLLDKYASVHLKAVPKVSVAVMTRMKSYNWPGNIRELSNVIEHYFISGSGNRLRFDLDVLGIRKNTVRPNTLAENEREYILKALKTCDWKVSGKNSASEYLGLNEGTLRSKMKKMKIARKKS